MFFRSACCIALLAAQPGWAEVSQGPKNVPEFSPAFTNQTRAPEIRDGTRLATEVVATGLAHPWGIAVLPEGGYLVTERVGRLSVVGADGSIAPVDGGPKVLAKGQGGLLDVALAEDFETSRRIYLTYAKPVGFLGSATAAATGVLSADGTELSGLRDIFVQTPSSRTPAHFGSRIVLNGDNAFITVGEHSSENDRVLAQDLRATFGKVVRITLEGGVPSDNPFVGQPDALGEIYSFGHRNPQGADLHPETGELWTLEHGPKGGDELNLIAPGSNYGWPIVSYGENYSGSPIGTGRSSAPGLVEPRYYWDPVIAPGGFAFYDGTLFDGWQGDVIAGSLNPGGIVRLTLDGDRVTGEARYLGELGRVRDVEIDRDGALVILIDDPQGSVIRVKPE